MKSKVVLAAVPIAFSTLAGCLTLDPETVEATRTADICYAWAVARVGNSDSTTAQTAYDELLRRGAFPKKDLDLIRQHGGAAPGMTENGAICAWGGSYDSVNTMTTANGMMKQYVARFESGYTRYFYTQNGIVTAVQEQGL